MPSVLYRDSEFITKTELQKLLFIFENGYLHEEEPEILAGFRISATSGSLALKRFLAKSICRSIKVPRDIILKLSYDNLKVAKHLLRYSQVLSSEDLVNIIRDTRDLERMRLISLRDDLEKKVLELLSSSNDKVIVQNLSKYNVRLSNVSKVEKANFKFSMVRFFEADIADIYDSQEYILAESVASSLKHINYTLPLRYLSKGDFINFFVLLSRMLDMPFASVRAVFSNIKNENRQRELLESLVIPKDLIDVVLKYFEIFQRDYSKLTDNNLKNHLLRKLSTSGLESKEVSFFISLT